PQDLGRRAVAFAALDLEPAGIAIADDLAALAEGRRRQVELGAAADAPAAADVDAVAVFLGRDYRTLERKALGHVVDDIAHGAVDAAGAAGARDFRQDDLAAGGVEFGLDQVAVVILGNAAHHDHVH